MKLTRRRFVASAIGGALAGSGIYEVVDRLSAASSSRAVMRPLEAVGNAGVSEQHLMELIQVPLFGGGKLVVPPLHHALVTARVASSAAGSALADAQQELEETLITLEHHVGTTSAGLGIVVAWGMPYFRRYVREPAQHHLPVDHRASAHQSRPVSALLDSPRFPSDPAATILEANDVAILLRSDSREHIDHALRRLAGDLAVLEPTSIRRGFTGGAPTPGATSLPKRMALAFKIPGAELIPDDAQLFLGFTSTAATTLGRGNIANLETLGYSDGGPENYFLHGTTMHVSHLFLDLRRWYRSFPDLDQTLRMSGRIPAKRRGDPPIRGVPSVADVTRELRVNGAISHSTSIQLASRLPADYISADGSRYEKGTAVPQRADFNTLDNPFVWSAQPRRDHTRPSAAAGLHFVVFHPTSDDFHRTRLAMDGVLPNGRRLGEASKQGVNPVMRTTHRQNFLVPPREHRSFPLAELL